MLTRWFWTRITVAVLKKTNKLQAHREPVDGDRVEPMEIGQRYPGLKGSPIMLSRLTPASEDTGWLQHRILAFVLGMKERLHLGGSYAQPYREVLAPYPPDYETLHPAPVLPEDFRAGADAVAGVATRGPFSILTRRVDGGFEIDLTHIEKLQPRPGFLRLGGKARFRTDGDARLKTEWIELEGARVAPGQPGYELVQKRFLAGMNAHETFIEHLVYCHMIVAGPFAMACMMKLPAAHPLRWLFQPFIIETMRVNNDNIDGLILSEASNVPSYTGYSLDTLNAVLTAVSCDFDLALMDPERRARHQGTADDSRFVTIASRLEIWDVYRRFTDRYFRECLREVDADTRAWAAQLDVLIPNGVRHAIGLDSVERMTLEQAAHLAAICMYTVSATHHLVADTTRNHMMSAGVMPPAVWEDGFPRLGMVLEKMNSIAIAGVLRYKLLDENVPFASAEQRNAWTAFQADLRAIQAAIETDAAKRPYRIEPNRIPSSIHA